MTKEEFLSACLPYKIHLSRDGKKDGGRLRDIRVSNVIGLNGCRLPDRYSVRVGSKSIYYNNIENYIPIVRSLTDLTKPIVQADYNDGKPFVPIDIIQQLSGYDNYEKYIGKIIRLKNIDEFPYYLIEFCLQLHFDLITEDCEKVYVTDEFNPYK